MVKTLFYTTEDRRLPYNGELIKVSPRIDNQGFQNIVVSEDWTVQKNVKLFDVLTFKVWDDEVLFQIRPTTTPRVGVLVFIKRKKLIDNWRASKKRPTFRLA